MLLMERETMHFFHKSYMESISESVWIYLIGTFVHNLVYRYCMEKALVGKRAIAKKTS